MSDKEDDKYINPRTNPFIKTDDVPLDDSPDETPASDLVPWPPPQMQGDESDPLHGLDNEKLKDFIGAAAVAYVYGERFYSLGGSVEEKISMPPVLVLTRQGDSIQVKRADGTAVITADEAALVRLAIEDKAKRDTED